MDHGPPFANSGLYTYTNFGGTTNAVGGLGTSTIVDAAGTRNKISTTVLGAATA